MKSGLWRGAAGCALAALLALTQMADRSSPLPRRDINAVLADHDKELLAIPGVAGVYVGLLPDGKTQCLKVMLEHRVSASAIPRTLEGYRVMPEITGKIRPL